MSVLADVEVDDRGGGPLPLPLCRTEDGGRGGRARGTALYSRG